MRVHLACKSPTGPRAIIAIITARVSQSGERMGQLGLMGGRKSGFPLWDVGVGRWSGQAPAVAHKSLARVFYSHANASRAHVGFGQKPQERGCVGRVCTRETEFRCEGVEGEEE